MLRRLPRRERLHAHAGKPHGEFRAFARHDLRKLGIAARFDDFPRHGGGRIRFTASTRHGDGASGKHGVPAHDGALFKNGHALGTRFFGGDGGCKSRAARAHDQNVPERLLIRRLGRTIRGRAYRQRSGEREKPCREKPAP